MRLAPLALSATFVAITAFGNYQQVDPTAEGGVLLVTNKSGNTLSIIDPATGQELKRLDTGPSPHEVAVTPDGRLAFVANYGANSLTVVDVPEQTVVGLVDLGEHSRPHGLVVSKDGF